MTEGSKRAGGCLALQEELALAGAPRLLCGLDRRGCLLQRKPLACTQTGSVGITLKYTSCVPWLFHGIEGLVRLLWI